MKKLYGFLSLASFLCAMAVCGYTEQGVISFEIGLLWTLISLAGFAIFALLTGAAENGDDYDRL